MAEITCKKCTRKTPEMTCKKCTRKTPERQFLLTQKDKFP